MKLPTQISLLPHVPSKCRGYCQQLDPVSDGSSSTLLCNFDSSDDQSPPVGSGLKATKNHESPLPESCHRDSTTATASPTKRLDMSTNVDMLYLAEDGDVRGDGQQLPGAVDGYMEEDSRPHDPSLVVGDAVIRIESLELSAFRDATSNFDTRDRIVTDQEQIWRQIKTDNARKKEAERGLNGSLGRKAATNGNQGSIRDSSSTKGDNSNDVALRFQGKRVKLVPQSRVEEAWRRGEAILVSCVVCSKKLLATSDMTMIYCPECGSLSSSDLVGGSSKSHPAMA